MKKVKKIIFTSNSITFAKRQLVLTDEFEARGYVVQNVTYSRKAQFFLEKHGKIVENIIDKFETYKINNVQKELEKYEDKYKTNVNLLLTADKNYSWKKRSKALTDMAKHFRFWEEYLAKNKPNIILGGQERFIDMIPRIVAPYFGAVQMIYKVNPIPNTFVTIKDPVGRWDKLTKYWKNNKNKKLTIAQIKKVKKYLNTTKKEKKLIYNIFTVPRLKELTLFLRSVYNNARYEKFKNPYANLWHIGKEQAIRPIRKPIAKYMTEAPKFDETYFYFPLHRSGDAQILLRAPQYYNQFQLIETISKHLPIKYKLYVKQHPNGEGEFKISDLWKIKKLKNIKLIDTKTNTHDILKNAAGVITINSNSGWEALLHKKPVIVLGNVYYDIFDYFEKVRDFYELPTAIKKATEKKLTTDQQYKYINAVIESTHPGQMLFVGKYEKLMKNKNNTKLLVDGFENEFKKL
jgi:capsule polysaccharide modification protein KpsS